MALTLGEKRFMLGNEAIARGALEGGVQVATGYPGTPSSEIVDTLAAVADEYGIYVEWSVNEKVALEIALAASYCRLRAMSAMKHVGLNVAHDAVMTAAHIGARGGLVIVSCDDPGAWSSQNEQDNRFIAAQAYLPVFEPCNPQEAKDMTRSAFDFSETHQHPVMLRSTTRVSHATGDVTLGEVQRLQRKAQWEKRPDLLVYDSAGAKRNRVTMVQRFDAIRRVVNESPYNRLELAEGARLGLIAPGLSYSYVKEALRALNLEHKLSVLKLGMTYPPPAKLVETLLSSVDETLVVEELEPFVELHVKALAQEIGVRTRVHGKDLVPLIGELSMRAVVNAVAKFAHVAQPPDFATADTLQEVVQDLPPLRPPALCPGCPHRASYYSIRRVANRLASSPRRYGLEEKYGRQTEVIFPGDIGCYGLAYLPPFQAIDCAICMGGGLGFANGLAHLVQAPIITSIGDSTFFHAGIPALLNAVHNNARMVVCVLDNDVTAMTGEQPHPGSAYGATSASVKRILIEEVARGCGVNSVEVVDPSDMKKAQEAIERALQHDGPAVVVFRRACELVRLRDKAKVGVPMIPYVVDQGKCTGCLICINLFACPAIFKQDKKVYIDPGLCTGCADCVTICPFDAFVPIEKGVS